MATVMGSFEQVHSSLSGPLPLALWKTTVTIATGATTASIESSNKISGVVTGVWIDPGTLTASATIKGYAQNDGLTTPTYFLNYTVPNPAAETRAALNSRLRVFGKLQIDVASATAADSFTIYVWVDPSADTNTSTSDEILVDIKELSTNLVPNSTQADQALTVDATAGGVQFAAFHADTTHVEFDVQTAQIRYTLDNSAPTSSNGHILEAGDFVLWPKAKATAAKFIRTGSTSAVLHASQLKGA
jgi:hypothetical protein